MNYGRVIIGGICYVSFTYGALKFESLNYIKFFLIISRQKNILIELTTTAVAEKN